jgi:hypothetical protein
MKKKSRNALISRASAVALSFAACSSLPVFSIEHAMGSTVTYTGSNGAAGQNGQSESQTLSNTGQLSNYLSVIGGNGGDNDGGATTYNGGDGGNASATGNETFFTINSLSDIVTAIGGNGGAGEDVFGGSAGTAGTASAMETDTAAGGSVTIQSTAQGGNGGDTINATAQPGGTATAGASTSGDGGSVNITVMSIGGNGGNAEGSGNGGNGGSASFSTINGVSLNTDVTITASLIGGNGGSTNVGNAGGNGGSVSVSNGITGSAPSGTLSLTQNSTGGNGGSGTYGAGNGGDGSSSLSISTACNDLFVTTNGTGGAGGSTEYNSPGQGGNGTANASGTNTLGNVTVGATAAGGAVGAFSPFPVGDQFPANGGSASSSATATGSAALGANVTAISTATGAAGATVDPDPNTFNGGNGGNATAMATATGAGFFSALTATATATGGGAGGNQTTDNHRTIGVAGTATAIATVSDGTGSASATATAGNSVAGETITSTASGSVGGGAPPEFKSYTTSTLAYSAVAQPVSSQPGASGYQAFVENTGLPSKSDSQAALAGQPNVQAYFGPGSTVLGLISWGGGSNGDGVSHTWTSSTTVSFSLAEPLSHDLILGLLSTGYTGNGFDSLAFDVLDNGNEIFSAYYTSASVFAADLPDTAYDLGSDSGVETLEFDMSLMTSAPGDSFQMSVIYGDGALGLVPEPCGALLMALPAFALCLRLRRRR